MNRPNRPSSSTSNIAIGISAIVIAVIIILIITGALSDDDETPEAITPATIEATEEATLGMEELGGDLTEESLPTPEETAEAG